ncbi:hypothetical protein EV122DRAFT_256942 [Schizophyllum commune]|uniref:uncharacterized protein n=1 Tax=Schizophyllum commune (strain H4-8 / FGSC 9210) TaxID=578458 RepID=UPI002160044D|nr:uncharacterized protein SCHCODRAFT_02619356 [Schizophyllum commune H4-8]KAI4518407.1 hypothetical protein K525DRAFT_259622 [Schizophyllum commune Loenen D]KAI5833401.1 hypothetical protein K523DRAFT_324337 [Schizophyllum commune Tattone D]KAI5895416.1 hypothetical protein SCHCODRAFT_02619356 [Schizophyllum commune H4-8]
MAAIAPITGMLRKRFFFDLSFALSVGVTSAYGYWYLHHLHTRKLEQEYYLKIEKEKL